MTKIRLNKIYLASKSPRRRELLAQIGVDFEVLAIDIPEEVAIGEGYLAYSQRISHEKALAAWEYIQQHNLPAYPVLTADTEVVIDDEVLGKPSDDKAAFEMLRKLSGRRHLALTSMTLKYGEFDKTVTSESWVYFDTLSDEDINTYLATGNHRDKSGSYGIQSFAGQFIQKIDGCFYSIMGLPLNTFRNLRKDLELFIHAK